MVTTTHSARITGPVAYLGKSGEPQNIPLGPCLVERGGGPLVDIIWGEQGQNSAALPMDELKIAAKSGHLVLLDERLRTVHEPDVG